MYEIILFAALLFVSRSLLVLGAQFYSHTSSANKTRIYRSKISEKQNNREKHSYWWFLFESTGIVIFTWVGLFSFTYSTGFGFVIFLLSHVLIVELLYYWYHRLLHTKWLYKNHHYRHHSSVIPQPLTSITFTAIERMSYGVLFAIPPLVASYFGVLSFAGLFIYALVFDFINHMGHFNFEIFPKWYLKTPLKWLLYTPSYHSQHHTKFTTNFALFMPIYDLLFNTVEKQSDNVFKQAKSGKGLKNSRDKPTL